MLGRQHLVSGVAAGLGCVLAARHLGAHLNPAEQAAVVATWAIGSLGPDLDCPTSTLSRWTSPCALLARVARRKLGSRWRPRPMLSRVVCATSGAVYRASATRWDDQTSEGTHRRLAHTVVWALGAGLLMTLGLAAIPLTAHLWWLGGCMAGGHLVHLAGDLVTPAGVPLAWPARHRGKRWWMFRAPLTFRAGGGFELVAAAPVLQGVAVALVAVLAGASGLLVFGPAVAMVAAGVADGLRRWKRARRRLARPRLAEAMR